MYVSAPNGITSYNDVMRYMVNDTLGETISLNSGSTASVTDNFSVNTKFNDMNCSIIVFVQSRSTQQVFGAEKMYIRTQVSSRK